MSGSRDEDDTTAERTVQKSPVVADALFEMRTPAPSMPRTPPGSSAASVAAVVVIEAAALCLRTHPDRHSPCHECTQWARWAVARFAAVWDAAVQHGHQTPNPYTVRPSD